ncbi:hypothetical protein C8Q72DRAFT_412494 [Fomitopsis betulina]|nr:hypothetical protein C8Q72DRAFT_412494 [Fomitopsis betulina]
MMPPMLAYAGTGPRSNSPPAPMRICQYSIILPHLTRAGRECVASALSPALRSALPDCVSGAGNTTCAGSRLDWYTDVVGETPCMTYQRLRQICHSEYEVGSFSYESPGDRCNDQVSTCCCSSIAWALSNLCRNCQWDIDSGSPNGLDAPHGAYYLYRFNHSEDQYCGDGTNQSLPEDIEKAVCNEGIKLENFLYDLFWNTGAWFYTYTRESAETDHAANGNNIYHCSSSPHSSDSAATSSSNAVQVPSRSSVYLGSLSNTVASITIAKTPSSTPSTPSFVTTFETPATIDGTTTTVPYTTTILYATQSGSAIGASAQGGERKSETAAIAPAQQGGCARVHTGPLWNFGAVTPSLEPYLFADGPRRG